MLRHKQSVSDRLADGGRNAVRHAPSKIDTYAAGALLVGMGNWLTMSVFNFDAVKALSGNKSGSSRAAYGALGLAALYATVRGGKRVTG